MIRWGFSCIVQNSGAKVDKLDSKVLVNDNVLVFDVAFVAGQQET